DRVLRGRRAFPTRRSSDLRMPRAEWSRGYAVGSFQPGTQVAWKPMGTRWGSSTRATGPAVMSDASRITTSERSSSWSYTKLTRRSEEHTSELQSPYDLVCR